MKAHKIIFTIALFYSAVFSAYAQDDSGDSMFDNSYLHEVRLDFSQPDYWEQMVENYESVWDVLVEIDYLMGTITIDGEVVDSVGVRFKGFTSYTSGNKKPIKIDFNEFVPGKKYDGLRKLNLNNGTGDPGMQRDPLCYDLLRRSGAKAPRTAFTRLYINGEYWGLYQLIEQVDKEFLERNFENPKGNLFKNKGWSHLEYLGSTSQPYKNIFQLKTNEEADDWSGLINFTALLNNTTDEEFDSNIEDVFDVDLYLKVLAVDVATNNWDSYLEHGRNYYMYHDTSTNKIHWIPWDYNFSLDGGGFNNGGGNCWVFADAYSLTDGTTTVQMFDDSYYTEDNPTYKWTFEDQILTDKNPKFTFTFPGVKEVTQETYLGPNCVDTRTHWVDTNYDFADCPVIVNGECPHPVDSIFVKVLDWYPSCCDWWTVDCEELHNELSGGVNGFAIDQSDNNGVLIRRLMANLEIKERYFAEFCNLLNHYMTPEWHHNLVDFNKQMIDDAMAEDPNLLFSYDNFLTDLSDSGLPDFLDKRIIGLHNELADLTTCAVVGANIGWQDIVVNEIVASNDSTSNIFDSAGEYDDWIELYNNTDEIVDLSGIYLSDSRSDPVKWQFPSGTTIAPLGYLIVWADNDESQDGIHSNFKLNKGGDELFMSNMDGTYIDSMAYTSLETNDSYSRIPNGTGSFTVKSPSFNKNNETTSTKDERFAASVAVYPNPTSNFINIKLDVPLSNGYEAVIYDNAGRQLMRNTFSKSGLSWNIEELPSGMYILKISDQNGNTTTNKISKI